MPLSEAQENKIADLRLGITAAPAEHVFNQKSCLSALLGAVDTLKAEARGAVLSAEQDAAIKEVAANVAAGASVLSNKTATMLKLFDAIDVLKSKPAMKIAEPKV